MNNLKKKRMASELSQSQLAAKANVSLPMIQKYEGGFKDINKAEAKTIYKLSKVLNTSMESLLEIESIKKEVEK